MRKIAAFSCLVLALILATALVPASSSADEFKYAGPPAFTVTYPSGFAPDPSQEPESVWRVKNASGLVAEATVYAIPEGITPKDYAEKSYMPGLIKSQKTNARMTENKEITLSDGTKAYYSEMEWKHPDVMITTMLVSVYKDGKCIVVAAHPWDNWRVPEKIVKSLKFQ
jgi:hypothetical protein